MRKFPGEDCSVWVEIEGDAGNVKNLSYFGELGDREILLLETLGKLLKGKSLAILENASLRECEAFLRDRNSEPALEGITAADEIFFKKLTGWLRIFPFSGPTADYHFSSEKGPFQSLKLVDKIKEIKAFLRSPEVAEIYQELPRPELVDVEDLTIYVAAPYKSERERALFHELHLMGVATFQEERLNFIPEG